MSENLKRTALHEKHVQLGAKMIEFAGFRMPVWYSGMVEETLAVRNAVGIFDLSHMGEVYFEGEKALEFLQYVTTNDLSKVKPGRCQYTLLPMPGGGVVDDLIVYRISELKYMLVVNAANIENDLTWFAEHLPGEGVEMTNLSDETSLIAVQGPDSWKVLRDFGLDDIREIKPFRVFERTVRGNKMTVSTTGYTGELGVELIVLNSQAEWLWDSLFEAGEKYGARPIGLGARDTLRLEVAYPLYGNELDKTTSPFEAGLDWTVKLDKSDFLGREYLQNQKESGLKRKIAGFVTERKSGIARSGTTVYSLEGKEIGHVTSGAYSPVTGLNIALAYLPPEIGEPGNEVEVEIRRRRVRVSTVKLPFYRRPQPKK